MAITAAQLQVLISADTNGAERGLARVGDAIANLSRRAGSAGGVLGGLFGAGMVALGNLVANAITYVTGAIAGLAGEAVDAYIAFERLQFSLQSIIAAQDIESGAASNMADALNMAKGQAGELYDWILKLAIKSPFSEANISSAIRQATAMGLTVDAAKTLVARLTDLATATGMNEKQFDNAAAAMSKIQSQGKLTGEAIRNLSRDGVPILQILGRALGKTNEELRQMASDGLLTADIVFKAFNEQVGKDYPNAVDRFLGSTAGLLNALGDLRAVILRTFFAGAIEAFKPALQKIVDLLQNPATIEAVREWGDKLGRLANYIIPILGQGISTTAHAIQDFVGWIMHGIHAFQDWERGTVSLKTVLTTLGIPPEVAGPLVELIDKISGKFKGLADMAKGVLGPAFKWLKENGLDVLKDSLKFVNEHFESFWGALQGYTIASAVVPALFSIAGALAAIDWPLLAIIAGITLLGAIWGGNWFGIRDTLTQAWKDIKPKLEEFATWLNNDGKTAVDGIATKITDTLRPALDKIGEWMDTQGVRFSHWFADISPDMQQDLQGLSNAIQGLWAAFAEGLRVTWATFGGNITGLTTGLGASLNSLWNLITGTIGTLVKAFLQALHGDWKGAYDTIAGYGPTFREQVFGTFEGLIDGLARLIGTSLPQIRQSWEGAFNQLGEIVGKVAGIVGNWMLDLVGSVERGAAKIRGYIDSIIAIINSIPKAVDIVFNLITSGSAPSVPHNALGVKNWGGGFTTINENGPEMVYLPSGSQVVSHTQSRMDGLLPAREKTEVHVHIGSIKDDMDVERMAYRIAEVLDRRAG